MQERVEFVEKHREEIIDSATRPLDGMGWWRTAEDPFQVCSRQRTSFVTKLWIYPMAFGCFSLLFNYGVCAESTCVFLGILTVWDSDSLYRLWRRALS